MTSKIIVAIVAAVLSLAAPVAVEAQPVEPVTFACSEAADSAVWRFYTARSIPPLVHDFAAQSNLPTDKIGLHVEQYAGDWNTRLSIPAGNLYAAGSTRLQAGQWTDVGVQCEGEGDVILTVTRRRDVNLRSVEDPTATATAGSFTESCPAVAEAGGGFGHTVRYFTVAFNEHMDFVAYATNPDTYINVFAAAYATRDGRLQRSIASAGAHRGSLFATGGSISDETPGTAIDPALIGRVSLFCRGSDDEGSDVTVIVTRREPVSLRRR